MHYEAHPKILDGEGINCLHIAAQFGFNRIMAYFLSCRTTLVSRPPGQFVGVEFLLNFDYTVDLEIFVQRSVCMITTFSCKKIFVGLTPYRISIDSACYIVFLKCHWLRKYFCNENFQIDGNISLHSNSRRLLKEIPGARPSWLETVASTSSQPSVSLCWVYVTHYNTVCTYPYPLSIVQVGSLQSRPTHRIKFEGVRTRVA